jgi:hypothetical protein
MGWLEFLKKGGIINNARSLWLLKDKRKLFIGIHETSPFLQDCAPCHKVKVVIARFAERTNITLIKWPVNSPDLNPSKRLERNEGVAEGHPLQEPAGVESGDQEVIDREDKDSQYLRNLFESMPQR